MGHQAMTPVICFVLVFCLTFISSRCSRREDQDGNVGRGVNGIKMAIQPQCGTLSSDKFVNFNTGVQLDQIKTIYSFGDSWTATGNSKGGRPKRAVPKGSDPKYGGRASNGPMWTEDLATDERKLKSYAVGGATVDRTLWSARAQNTDMISHVDTFINQDSSVETESSLATIFYGINDYSASKAGPGTLDQDVKQLLNQTNRLINAGLKKFIVVSPPFKRDKLDKFDSSVWNGFKKLKESKSIEFAYVDLGALFAAIQDNPSSFGYKSLESCLKSTKTTEGGCQDPDEYLYWIPSHPQYQTHRLISEWVQAVLKKCGPSSSSSRFSETRTLKADQS